MKQNLLNAKALAAQNMPQGELHDGGGLYLRISKIGTKAWIYRYRLNGKPKAKTFGYFPNMSLSQARIQVKKLQSSVAVGISPDMAQQILSSEQTFLQIMNLWFTNIHEKEAKPDTALDNRRRLENHAFELFSMPISTIKPSHLVTMFNPLVKKNQPETIKKTSNLIRSICDWAITQDIIEKNPALVIRKAFAKSPTPTPLPYIRAERLHEVFTASINGNQQRQSKDLLMCYVLTGLRAKELVAAKWENLQDNILTIEKQYMKNGKDFDVYLSHQARSILERQVKIARSPFIFYHRTKNDEGMSSETITNWLREDAGFKGELVTHGFRKMFSTWANEQLNAEETNTLYSKEIIERCLDHMDDDKIRSIYNGAIYPKLRLGVMQGWADFVGSQWQKAVANLGLQHSPEEQLYVSNQNKQLNPQ